MEWLDRTARHACRLAWVAIRSAKGLIAMLIKPKEKDEDSRRQEYILNIILVTSIALLVIFDGTVIYNMALMRSAYDGVSFIPFTIILLAFCSLFFLSKNRRSRIASYILIGMYTTGAIYCGYRWGVSLPATLLTTALTIFTSSILIGTRCGLLVSIGMVGILSLLGIREYHVLGVQPWKYLTISTTDIITYSGIFFFITMLSWLSNRQIEASLERARRSENELRKERDNLEVVVAERTEDLRRAQLEQMMYLSKTAEFGKLAHGMFHDLMSPLTSISLGIDILSKKGAENISSDELSTIHEQVRRTIQASNRMGNFMSVVRSALQHSKTAVTTDLSSKDKTQCDFHKSLTCVQTLLAFKLRNANVSLAVTPEPSSESGVIIHRNPIHIERILLNLISNAIDAYADSNFEEEQRVINITYEKAGQRVLLKIADFGCGISENNMSKLFTPFFTTKTGECGSGIGLVTTKDIVENELNGEISITSKIGLGTIISITFPD